MSGDVAEDIDCVPVEANARRAWIKLKLNHNGYTLSSLGRELGLSRHAPKLALDRPYPKMEKIIASKIGYPAQGIWPERYNDKGKPNRKLGRPKK